MTITREEAIALATKAGMTCYGCKSEKLGHSWHSYTDAIERLCNLVAERDAAIVEAAKNLIAQKGRHNTEIAYKRLEDAIRARSGK